MPSDIAPTSNAIRKHSTHPIVLNVKEVYLKDELSSIINVLIMKLQKLIKKYQLKQNSGYHDSSGKWLNLAHQAQEPAFTHFVNPCIESYRYPVDMTPMELQCIRMTTIFGLSVCQLSCRSCEWSIVYVLCWYIRKMLCALSFKCDGNQL